ncbi:hypothetical protein BH10ACI2_BH10ACI2_25190 [soil metagenome]
MERKIESITTELTAVDNPFRSRRLSKQKTDKRTLVYALIASFGIFGGISALFVGIVSVIIHAVATGDRLFDRIGTGLLIVAIPMILIGSLFVDEIEVKK